MLRPTNKPCFYIPIILFIGKYLKGLALGLEKEKEKEKQGFGEKKKGQEANFSDLSLMVTPTGFEPISSEPESEILSIELWGLFN